MDIPCGNDGWPPKSCCSLRWDLCSPVHDRPHCSLLLIILTHFTHLHTTWPLRPLRFKSLLHSLLGWDRMSCLAGDLRPQDKESHLPSISLLQITPFSNLTPLLTCSPIPHPFPCPQRLGRECKNGPKECTLSNTTKCVSPVTRALRSCARLRQPLRSQDSAPDPLQTMHK